IADRHREVADRRLPQFLRSSVRDLAPDPALELVGDVTAHRGPLTETASTAIWAPVADSPSHTTPVAAGNGGANPSRRTSAVLRYPERPSGVTNSVVFTTMSRPAPQAASRLPSLAYISRHWPATS